MDMNTTTLPKKGLKTRPYSMDMNKDIATLPKKGLKKYDYSIVYKMNKIDLKKLTKGQLIKLLLKQEKKPKVVIVDDTKPTRPNRPPPPIPEGVKPFRQTQTVKLWRKQKVVDDRPGWVKHPKTNRWIKIDGRTYRKLYPMQHVLNKIDKTHQEINETSKSIDDKYKKYHMDLMMEKKHQNPLGHHHYLRHQNKNSTSTMTYSKQRIKALKNSKLSVYKAVKIKNSKATRMNSKLKSLKNWTMLKRYTTFSKN